jgi:gas vesicle protein
MAQKVNNFKADALMLVGGGVVGAGLALLFAPYSGIKSRKKLVRFGKSMSNKSDRAIRNLSNFADTMGEKAGGMLRKW